MAHGMSSVCALSQGMEGSDSDLSLRKCWWVAWHLGNVLRQPGDVFPASPSPPYSWGGTILRSKRRNRSPLFSMLLVLTW